MNIFKIFKPDTSLRIIGTRVFLKPLKKKDLEQIRKWFRNRDLICHAFGIMAEDHVLDKIAKEYFNHIFPSATEVLGIWLPDNNLIGFVNYCAGKRKSTCARLGIIIGEEEHRNKGLGTESLNLALYYLFMVKGFERIELDTATFNTRAQKCFLNCGFKMIREITEVNFLDGELIHKYEMALDRDEFVGRLMRQFDELPKVEGTYKR